MNERIRRLERALSERVLCLDGATGTAYQALQLSAEDFGGEELEGCNEMLVLTRPDLVLQVHRQYLAAGADIIETNSFGATPLVLAEYDIADRAYEINRRAAELARQATAEFDDRPHWVAGCMGPTTKAISVTGGVGFEALIEHYRLQARGLVDGGADYLLLETCQDTRNIKAGLQAIHDLEAELGHALPVAVSGTIEAMGTMLAGQSAEALAISLAHEPLLYLGLNCATGPELMTDHLRALAELGGVRVACVPNAGLPDEDGNYLESPAMMAKVLQRFLEAGWVDLIGGCCGTTDAHVRAFADIAAQAPPRAPVRQRRSFYSGIDWIEATEDNRPLLVGERTNVIGSRRFRRLIGQGRYEAAAEIARKQVQAGAQIVDVCMADPDRDEVSDVEAFLEEAIRAVKAPFMIDSTDPRVFAAALPYLQGKSILNSVNLEDGEERFAAVVPLVKRFGAAMVIGCIDERGMAVQRERKLEIALRSEDLLTRLHGLPPEDLIFDALVFPCATGDETYRGSARETIEGLRLIKSALPHAKTILGISNVSFGLPKAGREVLNSVFLYECTKAGLDLAIVNTEALERYASIPEPERRLAEGLLFEDSDAILEDFVAHFRTARPRRGPVGEALTLDQRLARSVIEGSKEGLAADLEAKLLEASAMEIINGPLMAGMDEVGRLFNDNQLIVAEVLKSAEVMKAAVTQLEPHLDQAVGAAKGKVVLATVKGDVHDIGKNLVEIILSNNAFEVIDLGTKVPPQDIIEAVHMHRPQLVGLSGLLVKSAQMMEVTASEMTRSGVVPDLLVGGAALSRRFTRSRLAPAYGGQVFYAKDAMEGLALAKGLVDETARAELIRAEAQNPHIDGRPVRPPSPERARRAEVAPVASPPQPPDLDRHILRGVELDTLWPWINPRMLYGKHLGFRGDFDEALRAGDPKARDIGAALDELRREARSGRMTASAVWRWFPAIGDGDRLALLDPNGSTELWSWSLPRQAGGGLCLSDYLRSADHPEGPDSLALFVVTAGGGIREWAAELKSAGAYLRSYLVQALALETAEALAEWLHARLRGQWGFPDPPTMTRREQFKARYHGRRFSPGYPACPDLTMQQGIFDLLGPGEIGVELTDGCMMDPEASVSALVFHHPLARYFSVA
jgi:5-methyltetrahydrofolate--homocysteine methyltransferase